MEEFLRFRNFITPVIIQIIFWVGVVLIVLGGIGMLAASGGDGMTIIYGLVYIIIGPIFWRIACELMIVLFRIQDDIEKVAKNTSR